MSYKKYEIGEKTIRIIADPYSQEIEQFITEKSFEKSLICFDITSFSPEKSYCQELPPEFKDSVCERMLKKLGVRYQRNMKFILESSEVRVVSYPFCKKKTSSTPLFDFYKEFTKDHMLTTIDFNDGDHNSKILISRAQKSIAKILASLDDFIFSKPFEMNKIPFKIECDNAFESLVNLIDVRDPFFSEKTNNVFSNLGMLFNADHILKIPAKNKIIICSKEAFEKYKILLA